ncbi:MAG: CopG family antitoxin [Acidobacteriota bacterium]|nr:CopG family antitoxin [Acidobacteriota bacterium]
MAENDLQALPKFSSLDDMVDFFDNHDLGDYLDQMPEVQFDVNLQRSTRMIAVDEEIVRRVSEIAKQEHLQPELLVSKWLQERISSYSRQTPG